MVPLSNRRIFSEKLKGFSLVEVTVALGIATFCFLVIFGLFPSALSSNRDTIHQTAAAGLATCLVSDLRSTATTSTTSPIYSLSLSGTTTTTYLNEDGSISASATGNGSDPVYRASVVVAAPSTTYPHSASMAWVRITWPASINPTTKTPSGTYEVVVGLDRN